MGAFDDLIPQAGAEKQPANAFDDLIPKIAPAPSTEPINAFADLIPDGSADEVPFLAPDELDRIAQRKMPRQPAQPKPIVVSAGRGGYVSTPAPAPISDVDGAVAKFPGLGRVAGNVVVQDKFDDPKSVGQLESYPPWESYNPNPGKFTVEVYNKQASGDDRTNLIAGDMLHYIGAVDPSTNKPVDPEWRKLKAAVLSQLSPRAQAISMNRYKEAQAGGDKRTYPEWLDTSWGDEFIMGNIVHNLPEWQKMATTGQAQVFDQMRQYLGQAPAPKKVRGGAPMAETDSPFLDEVMTNVDRGIILPGEAQEIIDRYNKAHMEGAAIAPDSVGQRAAVNAWNSFLNGQTLQAGIARYLAGGGADVSVAQGIKNQILAIDGAMRWAMGGNTNMPMDPEAQNAFAKLPFTVKQSMRQMTPDQLAAMKAKLVKQYPVPAGKGGRARAEMLANLADVAGKYEGMPNAEGVLAKTAAAAGDVGGQLGTPENVLGLEVAPVRLAGEGLVKHVAKRVGAAAAGNVATTVATDPVAQGLDIAAGRQDAYDPLRTAEAAATAAVVGGTIGGTIPLIKAAGEKVAGAAKSAWDAWKAKRARSAEDIMRDHAAGAGSAGAGAGAPPPPPPGAGPAGAGAGAASGTAAPKPKPKPRDYTKPEWKDSFSPAAAGLDHEGNFEVDPDGYVVSDKGGPIFFKTVREAAEWIRDHGQKESADQVFDMASHPGPMVYSGSGRTGKGAFTVKETMRRPKEEPKTSASGENVNTGQEAPKSTAEGAPPPPPPGVTTMAVAGEAPAEAAGGPIPAEPAPATKEKPRNVETEEDLAAAGAAAASHPENPKPEPTDAQKDAGNYQKAHIKVQGLDIALENPKGSKRRSKADAEKPWEVEMPVDYGYLKAADGADGDKVDVFVGPKVQSQKAYVIDQIDPETGKYDEAKVMMGFESTMDALDAYNRSYSGGGAHRVGAVTEMSVDELKAWVKGGKTKKPVGDLSQAESRAQEAAAEGKPPAGLPDNIEVGAASEIGLDPKRFQFKAGGDEKGATSALQGVKSWDPDRADIVTVWRDKAGKDWVADGHQRVNLAHRLESEGHAPIEILKRVYKASEGHTAADVMLRAAIKNIAQGSGTPLDAAKVLRNTGSSEKLAANLPPQSALVRDAKGLAKLGDEAFGMAVNDVVPAHFASIVGREISGDEAQVAAMRVLAKANPGTIAEANAIIGQMKAQGFESTIEQGGLFGDAEVKKSMVLERAKVLAAAETELRRNRALFNQLLNREDVAAAAGNILDKDANTREKLQYETVLAHISKLANVKGEISDALAKAASDYAAGKRAAVAAREFIAVVANREGGQRRAAGSGDGGADAEIKGAEAPRRLDAGPHLPGFEPTTREAIAAKDKDERIKGKGAQKPADHGLFGNEHKQTDLETAAKTEVIEPWSPAKRSLGGKAGIWVDGREDFEHLMKSEAVREGDRKGMADLARRWVTEHGNHGKVEYSVCIAEDGSLISAGTTNEAAQTGFDTAMVDEIENGHRNFTYHHNHPSSASLSGPDTNTLMLRGVRRIVAHGNDGKSIWSAERGPAFVKLFEHGGANPLRNYKALNAAIYDSVVRVIDRDFDYLMALPDTANEVHAHANNLVLAKLGLTDYVYSGPIADRAHEPAEKIANTVIKALADGPGQQIFGPDFASRALRDRSPRPVRAEEAMDRVSQRPPDSAPGRSAGRAGPAPRQQNAERTDAGRAEIGQAEAPAFHASPHKVEKFSTEKIGTGEGHQAFGWGLYYAGGKGTAEFYRNIAVAHLNEKVHEIWEDTEDLADVLPAIEVDDSFNESEREFIRQLAANDWLGFDKPWQAIRVAMKPRERDNFDITGDLEKAIKDLKAGHLYQVDLKPNDEHYLDWDAQFTDQSRHVRDALDELGHTKWIRNETGEQIYEGLVKRKQSANPDLSRSDAKKAVSQSLLTAGVRGNRYLDAKSRDLPDKIHGLEKMLKQDTWSLQQRKIMSESLAGLKAKETNHNYVIFDDADVEITGAEAHKPYFTGGPTVPPRTARAIQAGAIDFLTHINRPGFGGRFDRWNHAFIRMVADDLIRGKQVQNYIEKATGAPIPDPENFYLHAEAAVGKQAEGLQQGERKLILPVFHLIRKSDHDLHWFEKGWYATDALDYNRVIANRDPARPDGGAGVMNATAAGYLNGLSPADKAELGRFIDLTKKIRLADLSNRVNAGLMDAQEAIRLVRERPLYAPMQGREDLEGDEEMVWPGQGFSVPGQEFKTALGRWTEPNHLLGHMIAQYRTSIMRAENNKVGQSLAKLIQAHPDDDFWKIDKVKYKKVLDKATGIVKRVYSADSDPENTIYFKINGEPHRIWIADTKFVAGIKKIRASDILRVLRIAGTPLSLWRGMTTMWSPEFLVGNMPRDIQDGLIQGTGLSGRAGVPWRTVKNYLPSVQQAFLGAHGADLGGWTKWMRRCAAAGGLSGNFHPIDIDHWISNVEKQTSKKMTTKSLRIAGEAAAAPFREIERFNTAIEAGFRVAIFRACIESGMSELQSAHVAKNATVNFDRKGTLGPYWSPLYAFFQAAINGNFGLLRILKKSPKFMAAVGGALFVAGASEALWWEWLKQNGTKEQKQWAESYDMAPDWIAERNLMVPTGKPKDAPWLQVPLGWALTMPYNFGRQAMRRALGKTSSPEMAMKMLHHALTWALPIDPERGVSGFLPTLLQPIAQVSQNEAWTGRPIYPDKHGKSIPDSENYYDTVSPLWKTIAHDLNAWTGGDEVTSGFVDFSPNVGEYLWNQYTSGIGATANRLIKDYQKKEAGEELDWSDIPMVRRFVGSTVKSVFRDQFYTVFDQISALGEQRENYQKAQSKAAAGDEKKGAAANLEAFKAEHKAELDFLPFLEAQKSLIDANRKQIKMISKNDRLTDAQKKAKKQVFFDRNDAIAKRVIEDYNRKVSAPRQGERAWIKVTPDGLRFNQQ